MALRMGCPVPNSRLLSQAECGAFCPSGLRSDEAQCDSQALVEAVASGSQGKFHDH